MKQPEDDKTIDMLEPPKAKPGRRSAGKTKLTAAQRQEARRARLRAAGKGFISAAVDASLIEQIDAMHASSGIEKNTIIENLLRQALSLKSTPRRARKGGEAAR